MTRRKFIKLSVRVGWKFTKLLTYSLLKQP